MGAIALDAVSKQFANGHMAVRDLSLDIASGELLVLVGPSGSGKSTALRLIAGLETPTRGRVLMGNEDVTHLPPQQRDLAMVFQSYALYPHKSVRENMAFGLRMRGAAAAEIAARVRRTAASLGIEALLDRMPAQLSGGQRQRVALGRAIVREPRAFLFDEPLSNLDPMLRAGTRAELSLLHRRLGVTMVYVTHDQEEAMTLGTRIAVMHEGRLEQVGRPLDVYDRPASVFVARFVGSPAMNLWSGAERFLAQAPAPPRPVVIGVRPHDIAVVDAAAGDVDGVVEVVEPLGAQTTVHVSAPLLSEELVRVVIPSGHPVLTGGRVGLSIRRDRIHMFDAATGLRSGGAPDVS